MTKFSKKGVLLFAGAMAVCAFVMPSMASAATWGGVGSEHTLHSPNIGFTGTPAGPVVSSCTNSTFTVDVRSAAALTLTRADFRGCTASGVGIGTCTATSTATPLNSPDWTITGPTTDNVQIHSVNIDITFEQHPGSASCAAAAVGTRITITGTLSGGFFNDTTHTLILSDEEGLVSHGPLGTSPVTARGTFTDTAGTLTLT